MQQPHTRYPDERLRPDGNVGPDENDHSFRFSVPSLSSYRQERPEADEGDRALGGANGGADG